jgi:hypothetical protein
MIFFISFNSFSICGMIPDNFCILLWYLSSQVSGLLGSMLFFRAYSYAFLISPNRFLFFIFSGFKLIDYDLCACVSFLPRLLTVGTYAVAALRALSCPHHKSLCGEPLLAYHYCLVNLFRPKLVNSISFSNPFGNAKFYAKNEIKSKLLQFALFNYNSIFVYYTIDIKKWISSLQMP